MSAALDVAVIGPLNVDLIVVGDAPQSIDALRHWAGLSDFTLNPAGAAGYPAQVFQKLGLRTGLLSVVTGDALGDLIRHELSEAGIDLSRVRVAHGAPGALAIYMLLFGDKKRPLTGRHSTHQPWPDPLDAQDLEYVCSARLVHVAGYLHYPSMWSDEIPNTLRHVQSRGAMTSLDPQFPPDRVEGRWLPGIERLLPYVNVLLVDQDEARSITGLDDLDAAARMMQSCGPTIVVIKCGAHGSVIYDADQRIEQIAVMVPDDVVVDMVGAGDAFDAGFLAALLRGCPTADAAKIGSMVAGISLRGHGAASALTAEDTIDTLIKNYANKKPRELSR